MPKCLLRIDIIDYPFVAIKHFPHISSDFDWGLLYFLRLMNKLDNKTGMDVLLNTECYYEEE